MSYLSLIIKQPPPFAPKLPECWNLSSLCNRQRCYSMIIRLKGIGTIRYEQLKATRTQQIGRQGNNRLATFIPHKYSLMHCLAPMYSLAHEFILQTTLQYLHNIEASSCGRHMQCRPAVGSSSIRIGPRCQQALEVGNCWAGAGCAGARVGVSTDTTRWYDSSGKGISLS